MAANSDKTIPYGNLKNRAVFAVRNFWSGLLFGIGIMAFGVGTVFHQLLQWHHFYDLSDEASGIFSDGILNLVAWIVTVSGLFLLSGLRKRKALWPKRWVGAALMGSGIYLLFDGLVIRKLLSLHQIRYGFEILPYDLAWNISGAIFFLTGLFMVLQTKKENHRK
ncbi:DUF2243 domain-containing protein [Metaplanococcus flavidus]|uniref:DUF2243 domain-containing protein n=1 Tax=Metaplanococcus flavidus TaxID=569883 RepID=A0ABW3L9Z3_9BACL